jgi:CRISPR-associated protein Csb2
MKGGVGELQVAVAGAGALADLRAIRGGMATAVEELLGPASGGTSWVTRTPFVPPRHLKKKGRSSLVNQVAAELSGRGFPPGEVSVLDWTDDTLALRHFVRRRRRGPQPPVDVGFAVRVVFDQPVVGPVCSGYGSHYGLGLFRWVPGPHSG